jgi:ribosomal subunit interface protein
MTLTVTGRHIDVGDALRGHVATEVEAIVSKYFDRALESSVVFDKRGAFFECEVAVHVGRGIHARGKDEADDPYVAFNRAAEHIAKRLRRHKRRLRDHHMNGSREVETLAAQQYILAGDDTAVDEQETAEPATDRPADTHAAVGEPVVVAEMAAEIPTLTVGEAVMRLDLEDMPAMMFRNVAHGGLNMIYRRPDGNVGWIDPRGNRENTAA